MKRRTVLLGGLGGIGATALFKPTVALGEETYPARPIRIVVANPPGGPGDLITRAFGEKASEDLGQPFVVENRPGASTVIGTQAVARAEPDGYEILNLTTSGVVQTVLQSRLPYSLESDFVPIIGIGYFPMVLIVSASSSIRTLDDLAAIARSPSGILYGSGGSGTLAHLAAITLLSELGGHGRHIPYRGNSEAMQGLFSGQIQMFFPSTIETISERDLVRPLAITTARRFPGLPDVPTAAELGIPGLNSKMWFAFLTPAGTPAPIVQRLYGAFAKAQDDAAFKDRLAKFGFDLEIKNGAESAAYIREESRRLGAIVKANGLRTGD